MPTNKSFRIIALRPLSGCNEKYLKILKKNKFYVFYNDYEVKNEKLVSNEDIKTPLSFYKREDSSNLNISISAIIGKNGDGKSSIVELIIRILNNFAYASGFLEKHEDLKPVNKLHAELYYEINGQLMAIIIREKRITWKLPNYQVQLNNDNKINLQKDELKKFFFYTQISNYSLYAYNSNEFANESSTGNGDWISGIFHKNDGYQTPVVLNPMRTNGDIDINRENGLVRDRLISLFLTNDETKNSFRWINDKQVARYFEISLHEGNSKLEEKIFKKYFIPDNKVDVTSNYITKEEKDEFEVNNLWFAIQQLRNAYALLRDNYQKNNEKVGLVKSKSLEPHKYLIKNLLYISAIPNVNYFIERFELATQITTRGLKESLHCYFNSLSEVLNFGATDELTDIDEIKKDIQSIEKGLNIVPLQIEDIDPTESPKNLFNLANFYYIALVTICDKVWRSEDFLNDIGENNAIISRKLYDYIVYKTLSILDKYQHYKNVKDLILSEKDLFSASALKTVASNLESYMKKIYADVTSTKSHVTLKLRQAINFFDSSYFDITFNQLEKNKYVDILAFCKNVNEDYDYFFPPVFKTDVILEQIENEDELRIFTKRTLENKYETNVFLDKNSKALDEEDIKLTRLSQLSSGERQQLNIVSSVIYHLRNINSVEPDNTYLVKYNYVNLIFEEIELYFHPEFQRTFINYLLLHLSKTRLENITDINLTFVTHSPFILSDIPSQNILALEKGEMKEMPFNTLGANIHEMLGHSFLLENTIGEVVKNKIDEFISIYNEYRKCKKEKTHFDFQTFLNKQKQLKYLINNLGEGYLKSILEDYYSELNTESISQNLTQENIDSLEKELRETLRHVDVLKNKLKKSYEL